MHTGVRAQLIGNRDCGIYYLCASCARAFRWYSIAAVWDGEAWLVGEGTRGYFDRWRGQAPRHPINPDHRLVRWVPREQVQQAAADLHDLRLPVVDFWG